MSRINISRLSKPLQKRIREELKVQAGPVNVYDLAELFVLYTGDEASYNELQRVARQFGFASANIRRGLSGSQENRELALRYESDSKSPNFDITVEKDGKTDYNFSTGRITDLAEYIAVLRNVEKTLPAFIKEAVLVFKF